MRLSLSAEAALLGLLASSSFRCVSAFAPTAIRHADRTARQASVLSSQAASAAAFKNATTSSSHSQTKSDSWIAASLEKQALLRTAHVVGPDRVLVYDTSLRGTFLQKEESKHVISLLELHFTLLHASSQTAHRANPFPPRPTTSSKYASAWPPLMLITLRPAGRDPTPRTQPFLHAHLPS